MSSQNRFYWVTMFYNFASRKLYILSPDFQDVVFVKQLETFDYMSEEVIHSYKAMLYEKIKQKNTVPYPSDIDQVKTWSIFKLSEINGITVENILTEYVINIRYIRLYITDDLPYSDESENIEETLEDYLNDETDTVECDNKEYMTIEKVHFFNDGEISEIAMMVFSESFVHVIREILHSEKQVIEDDLSVQDDMSVYLTHHVYPCRMNPREQEIFFAKVFHQLKGLLAYLNYDSINSIFESCKPIKDLVYSTYTELKKADAVSDGLEEYAILKFVELFEETLYQERNRIEEILYSNK